MKTANSVAHIPLFQHLSSPRAEHIQKSGAAEFYKKGTALFRQGQRAEAIWIVIEGWVHLVRVSPGQEHLQGVVIFTVTPNEALCGISALDCGTYHMDAIAGTDCRTLRIPAKVFRGALQDEAEFAYYVLQLCARRIQSIAQQYGTMAEPVSRRVIRSILRLRQQFGDTLPVTHRELAQMAWTTTESTIRTVGSLKHQGYLSGARGKLRIKQPAALDRLLVGHNGR